MLYSGSGLIDHTFDKKYNERRSVVAGEAWLQPVPDFRDRVGIAFSSRLMQTKRRSQKILKVNDRKHNKISM